MDLKVDKRSDSEDKLKTCDDCQTTTTPLWRGGPGGPKSLCNACGIKYHKKRRQLLGLQTTKTNKAKKKRTSVGKQRSGLKMRFMAIGSEIVFERSGNLNLREEERAALLLMALSCGGSIHPQYACTLR